MNKIEQAIRDHVNADEFFAGLLADILQIEHAGQRFKAKLELLDYVIPKIKTVDPVAEAEDRSINISYETVGHKGG